MQLQQDTLFDNRYRLKKLLGCGGFSEVWLVEDAKVSNKRMALKIFVPDRGLDDDGVQLFSREFELVFDLNHTHLLRPAHFDVCEHSPYLLMPYCEQGSVSKSVGRLAEEDAWHFLHDVADGLAFLHAQEPPIIHQDIKPDNILMDHLGHYLVTDFGISAKARSTLRKSVNSIQSGGTMAYMPPERFGRENTPIKASDVWATGATLFELLAGDVPFGEHGGLIQKSGAEIPYLPGQWSKELQEIIVRCLQKDPWDRPVAQQLVEWTENHLKGEKIVFEPKQSNQWQKIITDPIIRLRNIKNGRKIAGCVLGLLLLFFIINKFTSGDDPPENRTVIDDNDHLDEEMRREEIFLSFTMPMDTIATDTVAIDTVTGINDGMDTIAITPPASKPSTPSVAAAPPAWIAEYDRIMKLAQSAFSNKEYETARTEYNKAFDLAVKNRDRRKEQAVTEQIAVCDREIEAGETAKRERLASYSFVGNFTLGTAYMVVQRKSDHRWGIIDREGHEVEAAGYSQVSARLKNGYYALKNDKGWVVFDTSLNKVASDLKQLNDYQ